MGVKWICFMCFNFLDDNGELWRVTEDAGIEPVRHFTELQNTTMRCPLQYIDPALIGE